jgi:hypothetical protein
MALAQDQRAMLQLLLERGQSYDDIASLLGGSQDDVRRRARAALEELAGEDPDSEVGLTDYLLGQADPIGRADAVRHLQSDPAALALAEELSAKLRLLAPEADLPELPQPKKRRRAAAPVSPASPGGDVEDEDDDDDGKAKSRRARIGEGLSQKQTRTIAAIGAGAVVLLFVVLAIAGVFGGGDDSSSDNPVGTTASGSAADEEVAKIALEPVGDADAGGEATVGLANQTQPFADLRLQGLPQISGDEAYILWFLIDDKTGFPVPQALQVSENGSFDDRLAIPVQALGIVAQARSVAVSVVNRKEFSKQIAGAIQDAANGGSGEGALQFAGDPVLQGDVPKVPADQAAPAPGDTGATVPDTGAAVPDTGAAIPGDTTTAP